MSQKLLENEILKVEVGSKALGTSIGTTSDTDLMSVAVEPLDGLFGLENYEKGYQYRPGRGPEDPSGPGDIDLVVYPLKRWFSLAIKGNPSIMIALWAEPLLTSFYGEYLRSHADRFVSKAIFETHIGYANSQIKRLERGKVYKSRQKIADSVGYDCKYAMHALRLVVQGQELATTRGMKLPIDEPWLSTLREIRAGNMKLENFYTIFNEELNKLRKLEETSTLPDAVDRDWVNNSLLFIYSNYYSLTLPDRTR